MSHSSPNTSQRDARHAWSFFGGTLAWIGYLFLLLPSLIIIPVSFGGGQELSFPPKEFSLDLFTQFFTDPGWWTAAVRSAIVASATTILSLLVGIPAAYGFSRSNFPGRKFLEILSLAPMLVPVIVLGLGMYMHLAAMHLVNSLTGVVMAHTVLVLPFVLVSVSSGIRHIDPALETVALMMGASRFRIFKEVVLPQIRTSALVGALFAFLISFDEIVVAYFITGPESTTLPVKMYSAIRWEISPVLAAVSTLLTLLSLAICLAILAMQPQKSRPI